MAGLAAGFWQSREEIGEQWAVDKEFQPQMRSEERERLYAGWQKAVKATMGYRIEG